MPLFMLVKFFFVLRKVETSLSVFMSVLTLCSNTIEPNAMCCLEKGRDKIMKMKQ